MVSCASLTSPGYIRPAPPPLPSSSIVSQGFETALTIPAPFKLLETFDGLLLPDDRRTDLERHFHRLLGSAGTSPSPADSCRSSHALGAPMSARARTRVPAFRRAAGFF